MLCGGQTQFAYMQAARDTNRQPHTGGPETEQAPRCRLPPWGAQRPQGRVPLAEAWDRHTLFAKSLNIGATALLVG